jgi:hypothetical protein
MPECISFRIIFVRHTLNAQLVMSTCTTYYIFRTVHSVIADVVRYTDREVVFEQVTGGSLLIHIT